MAYSAADYWGKEMKKNKISKIKQPDRNAQCVPLFGCFDFSDGLIFCQSCFWRKDCYLQRGSTTVMPVPTPGVLSTVTVPP